MRHRAPKGVRNLSAYIFKMILMSMVSLKLSVKITDSYIKNSAIFQTRRLTKKQISVFLKFDRIFCFSFARFACPVAPRGKAGQVGRWYRGGFAKGKAYFKTKKPKQRLNCKVGEKTLK